MIDKLQFAGTQIGNMLDAARELFVKGTRVTFIARPPGGAEQDFLMTDDDLKEVASLINRRLLYEEENK